MLGLTNLLPLILLLRPNNRNQHTSLPAHILIGYEFVRLKCAPHQSSAHDAPNIDALDCPSAVALLCTHRRPIFSASFNRDSDPVRVPFSTHNCTCPPRSRTTHRWPGDKYVHPLTHSRTHKRTRTNTFPLHAPTLLLPLLSSHRIAKILMFHICSLSALFSGGGAGNDLTIVQRQSRGANACVRVLRARRSIQSLWHASPSSCGGGSIQRSRCSAALD